MKQLISDFTEDLCAEVERKIATLERKMNDNVHDLYKRVIILGIGISVLLTIDTILLAIIALK